MLEQDLHIHTTWSEGDSAVVPEQTIELVARLGHTRCVCISDHFELIGDAFDRYAGQVRAAGLRLGTEVNGHEWVDACLEAVAGARRSAIGCVGRSLWLPPDG